MSPRIGLNLATILQAAIEIADYGGIETVTLASVAQKLNVRSPSLYNHVAGLSGLRKNLALHGLKKLHDILIRAGVGRSGDDVIHAVAQAYVSFSRTHPGLYEFAILAPDRNDPEIQEAAYEIVELLSSLLHAYDLTEEEAIHTIRGLRCILHGFASLEVRGGFGLPFDLDQSFRLMIDTFLTGIQAKKNHSK